jgi:L-asparagine transporter-like permease
MCQTVAGCCTLLWLLIAACSKVNAGMVAAHRALYKAAADGDMRAFRTQQDEVVRLFLITYIQATLKYAELVDRAMAKNDMNTVQADQVGGLCNRSVVKVIASVGIIHKSNKHGCIC